MNTPRIAKLSVAIGPYSKGKRVADHPDVQGTTFVDPGRFDSWLRDGFLELEGEDRSAWKLKTSPAEYLERHPDGPNAELAREMLAESTEEDAAP